MACRLLTRSWPQSLSLCTLILPLYYRERWAEFDSTSTDIPVLMEQFVSPRDLGMHP
ncbi:uncharacterized protein EI90DRAFT_3094171 [Cantharellus anzutake]|uniref:uncharacterized protein n=1 Tax=Cantharellus anzutake TaxID=1750568 RepID=UPI00190353A8|nr:uncharacterized protein EI90DRAFT_3094171 [Cantharellus anzutake]KAF8312178.1 hypothetical protein EI90DRAFT_3094171 [Cantharellus anzutake]